jgi:uncharacterized protein
VAYGALLRATALLAAALVALAIGAAFLFGARDASFGYDDPFNRFPPAAGAGTERSTSAPDAHRDPVRFLQAVVPDIQAFWERQFDRGGRRYTPASVVIFRGATTSGCGPASSETGPFYCPLDQTVYLDPGFFRELAVAFRAPGDFAQAYVVAHEIGHHVQTLTGIAQQIGEAQAREPALRNELSIAQELQADCLAGVWGHSTYDRGLLERGDLDEALRAAAAVGDDRIQRRTTGRVFPEAWTHGSAAQRRSWFLRGFEAGDPGACDTFAELA